MEPVSNTLPSWLVLVIQGGALPILGYFLLVTLPGMMREWQNNQKDTFVWLASENAKQRESFERRASEVAAAVNALAAARGAECKYRDTSGS